MSSGRGAIWVRRSCAAGRSRWRNRGRSPSRSLCPRRRITAAKPIYFSCLVVRRDSGFASVEDTFGGRVAWTVENSYSGFAALRHHLLRYRTADRPESVRGVGRTADNAGGRNRKRARRQGRSRSGRQLRLGFARPARSRADRRRSRRRQDRRRSLSAHRREPGIEPDAADRLSDAFVSIGEEVSIRPALDSLLLKGFAAVDAAAYDITRRRADTLT